MNIDVNKPIENMTEESRRRLKAEIQGPLPGRPQARRFRGMSGANPGFGCRTRGD